MRRLLAHVSAPSVDARHRAADCAGFDPLLGLEAVTHAAWVVAFPGEAEAEAGAEAGAEAVAEAEAEVAKEMRKAREAAVRRARAIEKQRGRRAFVLQAA